MAKYPKSDLFTHKNVPTSWQYDTVLPKARANVWIQHFRMPEEMVNEICELVREDMSPSDSYVREPIPLKKR